MSNNRQNLVVDKKPAFMNLFAAALGAGIELVLVHPLDTMTKRIQKSKRPLYSKGQSFKDVRSELAQTIFINSKSLSSKVSTLYTGGSWAALHKGFARTYKFGLQPGAEALVEQYLGQPIKYFFGDKHSASSYKVIAASVIGLGESIFTPFDTLKVMYQNGEMRPMAKVIMAENIQLYKGAYWSALRNIPASALLFGVPEMVKQYFFNLDPNAKATFSQHLSANTIGAIASTVMTNPIDFVKTRVQSSPGCVSGVGIIAKTLSDEGLRAFTKGGLLRSVTNTIRFTLLKSISEQLPFFLKPIAEKSPAIERAEAAPNKPRL